MARIGLALCIIFIGAVGIALLIASICVITNPVVEGSTILPRRGQANVGPSKKGPSPPPPSPCRHNGTLAPPPSVSGCKRGVASVSFSNCSGTSGDVIVAPNQCFTQSEWFVAKSAFSVADPLGTELGGENCSNPQVLTELLRFQVSAVKTLNDNHFIVGTGELSLTNGGACPARLSSLLLILEQSISPNAGDSYGPGGTNQRVWSISGVENAPFVGPCNTPTRAQICEAGCNVSVPFAQNTVHDTTLGGPILNLDQYTVPASATCAAGKVVLKFAYLFVIPNAVWQQMLDSSVAFPTFRVTVLLTFDACCDRGSACGIDLNCDGTREVVRTVQTRSQTFSIAALNGQCVERCPSITVLDSPGALVAGGGPFCLANVSLAPAPPAIPLVFSQTQFQVLSSRPCCNTTSCNCTRPNLGVPSTYLNQQGNSIAFQLPLPPTCFNLVSGQPTASISPASASASFRCVHPAPVDCTWSPWSPFVFIPSPEFCASNGTECILQGVRNRTVTTPECHGGQCPGNSSEIDFCFDVNGDHTFPNQTGSQVTLANGKARFISAIGSSFTYEISVTILDESPQSATLNFIYFSCAPLGSSIVVLGLTTPTSVKENVTFTNACCGGFMRLALDLSKGGVSTTSAANATCCIRNATLDDEVCGCHYSEWSSWSACAPTQPGGSDCQQTRTRSAGQDPCVGLCTQTMETRACDCPVAGCPCFETEWTSWSSCDVSLTTACSFAPGIQNRTRLSQDCSLPPNQWCTEQGQCFESRNCELSCFVERNIFPTHAFTTPVSQLPGPPQVDVGWTNLFVLDLANASSYKILANVTALFGLGAQTGDFVTVRVEQQRCSNQAITILVARTFTFQAPAPSDTLVVLTANTTIDAFSFGCFDRIGVTVETGNGITITGITSGPALMARECQCDVQCTPRRDVHPVNTTADGVVATLAGANVSLIVPPILVNETHFALILKAFIPSNQGVDPVVVGFQILIHECGNLSTAPTVFFTDFATLQPADPDVAIDLEFFVPLFDICCNSTAHAVLFDSRFLAAPLMTPITPALVDNCFDCDCRRFFPNIFNRTQLSLANGALTPLVLLNASSPSSDSDPSLPVFIAVEFFVPPAQLMGDSLRFSFAIYLIDCGPTPVQLFNGTSGNLATSNPNGGTLPPFNKTAFCCDGRLRMLVHIDMGGGFNPNAMGIASFETRDRLAHCENCPRNLTRVCSPCAAGFHNISGAKDVVVTQGGITADIVTNFTFFNNGASAVICGDVTVNSGISGYFLNTTLFYQCGDTAALVPTGQSVVVTIQGPQRKGQVCLAIANVNAICCDAKYVVTAEAPSLSQFSVVLSPHGPLRTCCPGCVDTLLNVSQTPFVAGLFSNMLPRFGINVKDSFPVANDPTLFRIGCNLNLRQDFQVGPFPDAIDFYGAFAYIVGCSPQPLLVASAYDAFDGEDESFDVNYDVNIASALICCNASLQCVGARCNGPSPCVPTLPYTMPPHLISTLSGPMKSCCPTPCTPESVIFNNTQFSDVDPGEFGTTWATSVVARFVNTTHAAFVFTLTSTGTPQLSCTGFNWTYESPGSPLHITCDDAAQNIDIPFAQFSFANAGGAVFQQHISVALPICCGAQWHTAGMLLRCFPSGVANPLPFDMAAPGSLQPLRKCCCAQDAAIVNNTVIPYPNVFHQSLVASASVTAAFVNKSHANWHTRILLLGDASTICNNLNGTVALQSGSVHVSCADGSLETFGLNLPAILLVPQVAGFVFDADIMRPVCCGATWTSTNIVYACLTSNDVLTLVPSPVAGPHAIRECCANTP